MSDHVAELVDAALPDIEKKVAAALADEPKIETVFGAEPATDAVPYRVRKLDWVPRRTIATQLTQCVIADADLAFELKLSHDAAIQQFEDTPQTVIDAMATRARDARALERKCVLDLIIDAAANLARYDPLTIEAIARADDHLWRLLGTGPVAKIVKDDGMIDDVVDPKCRFPSGTSALLLRLDNGPTMQSVDDFRLTWEAVTASAPVIRMHLTKRFFVVNSAAAIRLV